MSNIVLDELDRELERRGLHFAWYADDSNIYVRSRRAGEPVMESLTRFIGNEVDPGMIGHLAANSTASPIHHVHNADGKFTLNQDVRKKIGIKRGFFARFNDDGVSCDKSRSHLSGKEEKGKVPGKYAPHHSEWLPMKIDVSSGLSLGLISPSIRLAHSAI
jgi:hypothetical protein